MEAIRASYLVTCEEAKLIMGWGLDETLTAPAAFLMELCPEIERVALPAVLSQLEEKGFLRSGDRQIVFEPVIRLIARNICAAETLWELRNSSLSEASYVVRCRDMWVLITPYAHAKGTWRVAPLPDVEQVKEELADSHPCNQILMVSDRGSRRPVAPDDDCLWLEEVQNG